MANEERKQGLIYITLNDVWYLFKRTFVFIILAVIIGMTGGYLVSSLCINRKYASSAYIYTPSATNLNVSISDLNISQNILADYGQIMGSRTIINKAIERAEELAQKGIPGVNGHKELSVEYNYSSVLNSLTISNPSETHIIRVTITTENPFDSAYLANAIADVSVELLPEIMKVKEPTKYQEALPVTKPVSPNNVSNAILGGLICGGATVAVLFVILLFNNTLKTEEDVARRLGLETLGVVSDANELAQIEEKSKKRKGENNE